MHAVGFLEALTHLDKLQQLDELERGALVPEDISQSFFGFPAAIASR
jgi:hypothetical protein